MFQCGRSGTSPRCKKKRRGVQRYRRLTSLVQARHACRRSLYRSHTWFIGVYDNTSRCDVITSMKYFTYIAAQQFGVCVCVCWWLGLENSKPWHYNISLFNSCVLKRSLTLNIFKCFQYIRNYIVNSSDMNKINSWHNLDFNIREAFNIHALLAWNFLGSSLIWMVMFEKLMLSSEFVVYQKQPWTLDEEGYCTSVLIGNRRWIVQVRNLAVLLAVMAVQL